MGIFFTWHSSEYNFHLDVKWKQQDELRGAANTVDWRSGGSLAAAHSCCQSPIHSKSNSQIAFQISGLAMIRPQHGVQLPRSSSGGGQTEGSLDYRLTLRIETANGRRIDIPDHDLDSPTDVAQPVYGLLCRSVL
jgi:hypothetical protein